MNKVCVVYWSGTGNTQAMAEAVAKAAEARLIPSADFSADQVAEYDAIAFGCPAMGAEVLEEDEFQPLFDACKPALSGKKIALFGSYGWGDGEWMRSWEADCEEAMVNLVCESVICIAAPDDTAIEACKALGKAVAG